MYPFMAGYLFMVSNFHPEDWLMIEANGRSYGIALKDLLHLMANRPTKIRSRDTDIEDDNEFYTEDFEDD